MGGFVKVTLKDKSSENIERMNNELKAEGVQSAYRFYSEDDVKLEYKAFKNYLGHFPKTQFPRDEIKSYKDFTKYWSTEALGDTFCPEFGSLTCDCYFGRMSQRAMDNLCKFIALFSDEIEKVEGSWSTLIERGSKNWQRKVYKEFNLV